MLSDGFLAQVERRPGAPALIWHGDVTTYGELGRLARECMPPGGRRPLAVVARKAPAAVARVLGGLMAGRPVLLPSPDLPPDVLDGLLAAADREIDAALLLTTSGSTGTPKIVPLPHGGIERFVAWAATTFGIGSGTTVLSYAPLNFDLSLLDVWTTLERGGCVALVDPARATRAGHLRDVLGHGVQVVQGVPMLYRLLRDLGPFDHVAHAIVTGDRMPTAAAELPALFPHARIHNVYGCTETNDSFIHELDGTAPMPIGRPLPGVEALVIASDGRLVQGPGAGELAVRTPFQTPGYLDPRLDDGRFLDHDGRRFFRTGDLVRRDGDGVFTLEGRLDAFVKVRGMRVCLPAVEEVIAGHPHVAEAAVVAVPDDVAGHRLHAVVRRRAGCALHTLAVRRHCARALDGAAVPSTIEIVNTPLPRTTTGKLDRRRAFPAATKEQA